MTGSRAQISGMAAVCALAALAADARASPVFSRKYGTACTTCHAGGPPRLNAFGEAFRLDGYRMPGPAEAELRREPEQALGAPAREQLFPNTVWPGELPASVPLAVVAHQRARVDLDRAEGELEFQSPHEVEALFGGTLGASIAFAGEVVLYEDGEFGGLGQLNAVFTDPLGDVLPAGWLSVRAGRVEPAAQPYRDALRRTLRPGAVSNYSVAADGFSLGGVQGGVELFGRPTGRVLWHAAVSNGESPDAEVSDAKDVYGGVEVKLGGMRYTLDGPPGGNVKPWRDDSITIGVSGYTGRHAIAPDDPMAAPFRNRFWRVAGKLRGQIADLDLQTAVAIGRDHDPDGTGARVDSLVWSAQADYVVYPWLLVLLLYDEIRIDEAPTRRALTPSVSAFARMNVLFRLEATFELGDDAADPLAQLELMYAF